MSVLGATGPFNATQATELAGIFTVGAGKVHSVSIDIGLGGPEENLSGQNITNEGQTLNGFGI
ncbi:MAG: hypothetical protein COA45_07710 [Zetaproteobacteria bacterium]|nr:MAG: hypothetical protein COA45_07710 [Zetaproteobacteria bacterium]